MSLVASLAACGGTADQQPLPTTNAPPALFGGRLCKDAVRSARPTAGGCDTGNNGRFYLQSHRGATVTAADLSVTLTDVESPYVRRGRGAVSDGRQLLRIRVRLAARSDTRAILDRFVISDLRGVGFYGPDTEETAEAGFDETADGAMRAGTQRTVDLVFSLRSTTARRALRRGWFFVTSPRPPEDKPAFIGVPLYRR